MASTQTPNKTSRLSDKQERSIAHASARINIWEGAVRSGKTIASLLRWLMFVARAPKGGALVVSGKTLDTVYRNVFLPLMDPAITGPAAPFVKYTRGAASANVLGRHIEVVSANDAKAEGRLRGLTAAGAYVDELTLIPESFFTQLLARLSVPGAKLFATTNPDGPAHWVRKKYLLRAGELNLRTWHFGLDDNPALDPDYVAALKAEYTGLWYRRMVNGEWCLAEGAIYESWNPDELVVDELPRIERWLGVGVDYGTTNPFAALMLGVGRDEHTGQYNLYLTNEYRYDSKMQLGQKTDPEYSQALRQWVTRLPRPTEHNVVGEQVFGVEPQWWFIDPSAASFILQMYRDGVQNTAKANNDVVPGIRTVAGLMAQGRLKVHRSCKGWIDEVAGYSWDDRAAERGDDKPIKVADHSLDAGRYVIHSTEHIWRPLLEL